MEPKTAMRTVRHWEKPMGPQTENLTAERWVSRWVSRWVDGSVKGWVRRSERVMATQKENNSVIRLAGCWVWC